MSAVLSGSLLCADVLDAFARPDAGVTTRLRQILTTAASSLGPAAGARHVFDLVLQPILALAGRDMTLVEDGGAFVTASDASLLCAAVPWNADLAMARRVTVARDVRPRWWIGCNGRELRVVDAAHAYSRRFAAFDVEALAQDDAMIAIVAGLLTPDAGAALAAAVASSNAHRGRVAASLQKGVHASLGRLAAEFARPSRGRRPDADAALSSALVVIYRILFLLFAEARRAVPEWHPVYRRSYTIESLRPAIERRTRPVGLWASVQAISRLAHSGCRAGSLRVTAFNGRLFAPAHAPLAERTSLDESAVRDVLFHLTTHQARDRRERIAYADLGVEQLGAVYERVLDYPAHDDTTPPTLARSVVRKASGTFYTPRALTEFLVRRTLAPLVRDRTPEQILALRVVDPAMGSGAFLVAACRYLAGAYERSLLAEGAFTHLDITASDRAAFRRAVAQRCLYGVDSNPMAVQLARLSLWLCTLAADKPLNFLDHHLRCGNSLIGCSPDDVRNRPPGGRIAGHGGLPLFDLDAMHQPVARTVALRTALASEPDDAADVVRRKERTVAMLESPSAPLATWRALCDAWCAAWFWDAPCAAPTGRVWTAVADAIRGAPSGLPGGHEQQWRSGVAEAASRQRFFHWAIEFPEVFADAEGGPVDGAGFDAVIGNPPWEMLRGDAGDEGERSAAAAAARRLTAFARGSGCYRLQRGGHANLYQLFAERMMQLAGRGGRLGMLMPGGVLTDHGCAAIRRTLLDRFDADTVVAFDNREGIFPIHRAFRFNAITATAGGRTASLRMRAGVHAPAMLDDLPDEGPLPAAVAIPRRLIDAFGGEELCIPELATDVDRAIVARVVASAPPLASPDGWNLHVGRELNATDDRKHFGHDGLPVVEGKHLSPFRLTIPEQGPRLSPEAARRLPGARAAFIERLGYREVAGAGNRLTLIAAMIPAGVVTTHTIFCVKEAIASEVAWFLCGMFNSFVANYLVRLRGSTHVTASTLHQLPVPRPATGSGAFRRVADAAQRLAAEDDDEWQVALQVAAAELYGLGSDELDRVLETFPLVDEALRSAVARAYTI